MIASLLSADLPVDILQPGVKCELVLLEGEGHGFSANSDYPAMVAKRVKDFVATGTDAKNRHQENGSGK